MVAKSLKTMRSRLMVEILADGVLVACLFVAIRMWIGSSMADDGSGRLQCAWRRRRCSRRGQEVSFGGLCRGRDHMDRTPVERASVGQDIIREVVDRRRSD